MDTFESLMFQYLDRFKLLFFPEQWDNFILNCSKNEIFILLLLYRKSEVNMSEIAEYINTPLNTATGIVTRMEKRNIILRTRSITDKRVVTVTMTDSGAELMNHMLKEMIHYGQSVMEELTAQETKLLFQIIDKVIGVLHRENKKDLLQAQVSLKPKKITIE